MQRHGTCYYTMNGSTKRSRKKSKDTLKQMKMRTEQSKISDTGKAIGRGKFIPLQAYSKKPKQTNINKKLK